MRVVVAAAVVAAVTIVSTLWARDADGPAVDTVFGSTVAQQQGEARAEAWSRVNATYGPVPVVRIFSDGLPPTWRELQRDLGAVDAVISFKVHPTEVLSGTVDRRLSAWFADAPTQRDTYWVYFHEPENNVEAGEFTAAQFREAWQHIAELAALQGNDRLHATVVLMCYTVNPASGRDWRDYVVTGGLLDVLAWDCYNHGTDRGVYTDPALLLQRAVDASRDADAAWGVAELGARLAEGDDGSGRARWLTAVGEYARRHGATFVTYFDSTVGGDFRLTDEPSIQAWKQLVTG